MSEKWEDLLMADPGTTDFVRTWDRDTWLRQQARQVDDQIERARRDLEEAEAEGHVVYVTPSLNLVYLDPEDWSTSALQGRVQYRCAACRCHYDNPTIHTSGSDDCHDAGRERLASITADHD